MWNMQVFQLYLFYIVVLLQITASTHKCGLTFFYYHNFDTKKNAFFRKNYNEHLYSMKKYKSLSRVFPEMSTILIFEREYGKKSYFCFNV